MQLFLRAVSVMQLR